MINKWLVVTKNESTKELMAITASGTAPSPIQPLTKWVLGVLSPWVEQPECEADHSTLSSAKVKNTWIYTSTPYDFTAWCLFKHRDNFTFHLHYHNTKCSFFSLKLFSQSKNFSSTKSEILST
jgi:hypothetical protein